MRDVRRRSRRSTMTDESTSGPSGRSVIKGLGVGASAGLADCAGQPDAIEGFEPPHGVHPGRPRRTVLRAGRPTRLHGRVLRGGHGGGAIQGSCTASRPTATGARSSPARTPRRTRTGSARARERVSPRRPRGRRVPPTQITVSRILPVPVRVITLYDPALDPRTRVIGRHGVRIPADGRFRPAPDPNGERWRRTAMRTDYREIRR